MYVVGHGKSHLKIGPGDIRKTGEKIPEAATWKPHVLQAHLSMNFIMLEDSYKGWKKQADMHDAAMKKRNQAIRDKRTERERTLAKLRADEEKKTKAKEKAEKSKKTKADKKAKKNQEPESDPETAPETDVTENETEIEENNESGETVDPPEMGLEDMSKSQLKQMAKGKGLKVSGTMAQLIERIKESDSAE